MFAPDEADTGGYANNYLADDGGSCSFNTGGSGGKILINTVAFQIRNQATLKMLEDCATHPEMAFRSDSNGDDHHLPAHRAGDFDAAPGRIGESLLDDREGQGCRGPLRRSFVPERQQQLVVARLEPRQRQFDRCLHLVQFRAAAPFETAEIP